MTRRLRCMFLGHDWVPSQGWSNKDDDYWGIDEYFCIRGKHYQSKSAVQPSWHPSAYRNLADYYTKEDIERLKHD